MADCYPAEITFGPLPQEIIDCLSKGEHPEDAGLTGPVGELAGTLHGGYDVELTDEYPYSWGTPKFTLDSKGIGRIVDSDSTYGVQAFRENGLTDVLIKAGVAYSMNDEGKYENDAEAEEWRPGMTRPWQTTVNGDDAPVLSFFEWDKIKAFTDDPAKQMQAVNMWLHGLPAIGEPVADETVRLVNELVLAAVA